MDEMYARMSATLLKAAQKHLGLNAVGMVGRCWMTNEIMDKLKEKEEVHQIEGIHTEEYKSLNEEVSPLTTEVKRGIWQHKVLEANETSEMWWVLKSLTYNKPNNNTCIITDNAQKSSCFCSSSQSAMASNEEDRFVTQRAFTSVQLCLSECPPAENALERCLAARNTMGSGLAS